MPHTQRILNHVDEDLCLQLIAHTCIRKPVHIVSHEYPTTTRIDLEGQVRAFDKKQKRIFDDIAQRIDLMRDDVGQELLGKLVEDQFALQRQNGPFNQAAWAFLNEPAAFEQAENERFADTARYTNRWDSFRVLAPIDQVPDIDGLREHLVTHFGGKDKVLVELFERHRPCIDGTLEHLMQVMVYREGLPSLLKEVSADKPVLKETMVHPAREYAFLWSPKRRELEVVSRRKNDREALATLFSEAGLSVKDPVSKLERRPLNLQSLKHKPALTFSRQEGIESADVADVKIIAPSGAVYHIHSSAKKAHEKDVYQAAQEDDVAHILTNPGTRVIEASIAIRFHKSAMERRAFSKRSMMLHLKYPGTSNLKNMTEMERHLSWSKLREWGLTYE